MKLSHLSLPHTEISMRSAAKQPLTICICLLRHTTGNTCLAVLAGRYSECLTDVIYQVLDSYHFGILFNINNYLSSIQPQSPSLPPCKQRVGAYCALPRHSIEQSRLPANPVLPDRANPTEARTDFDRQTSPQKKPHRACATVRQIALNRLYSMVNPCTIGSNPACPKRKYRRPSLPMTKPLPSSVPSTIGEYSNA